MTYRKFIHKVIITHLEIIIYVIHGRKCTLDKVHKRNDSCIESLFWIIKVSLCFKLSYQISYGHKSCHPIKFIHSTYGLNGRILEYYFNMYNDPHIKGI